MWADGEAPQEGGSVGRIDGKRIVLLKGVKFLVYSQYGLTPPLLIHNSEYRDPIRIIKLEIFIFKDDNTGIADKKVLAPLFKIVLEKK